jgi:hypothetical protein
MLKLVRRGSNAQHYYVFPLALSAISRPLDLAGDVESRIAARCSFAASGEAAQSLQGWHRTIVRQ